MVIREMSRDECLLMLAGTRLARLGCAHNNQPYVVPVSLVYHRAEGGEPCLYGVTTPGQKVEWMRANPLVCVEADEVATHDRWTSVVAFGRYEELPENPAEADKRFRAPERLLRGPERSPTIGEVQTEGGDERLKAFHLLKTHSAWWEPGWAAWVARAAHRDPAEPYRILYYKIHIDRVTGHESTRDSRNTLASDGLAPHPGHSWLRRPFVRLFGGRSKPTGPTP